MNYRPDPKELILWDTWMFPEPEGKRMHLFFLANRPDHEWEWVGHAVSDDLIHWQDLPPIQLRRPGDAYDIGAAGTGMVFASPAGEFMLSYTTNLGGPVQGIAFLHSQDLIHWEKRWPEPRMIAELPYYQTDGTQTPCKIPPFRDAFIHRVGDHYEALIGAQSPQGPPLVRGCIARYQSTDPELRQWKPLAPLAGPGITTLMEVPEHFQIGDHHYLIWSTGHTLGVACETPSRRQCWGTFYATSDSYDGKYAVPEENLLIGCSQANASYVGRTILWKGERLLYHHVWWPNPSLTFPKRLVQIPEGQLSVQYWPGLEGIHTEEISLPLERIAIQGENLHVGQWKKMGQSSLMGSIEAGGNMGLIPVELEDVHLRCEVTLESGTRFGISLRDLGHPATRKEGESKESKGVALQGDVRYGQWHFGSPEYCWCGRIDPVETLYESPQAGKTYRIDVIVRDIYFEAYVDGVWKFTRIIHDRTRQGGIGFFVEDGIARFENIQAWSLEPMNHPFPEPWPKE